MSLPRRLRPQSLTGRLVLASLLLLPVLLGLMTVILERSYQQSLQTSYQQQLELQTYLLMGAAEVGSGQLWMPSVLQEPRFNQPQSGLYAQVSDLNGNALWTSPSAVGVELPQEQASNDGERRQQGILANQWFYFSYQVIWQTEDGEQTPFIFSAYATPEPYLNELNTYRWNLRIGLGLLAAFLLMAQLLILKWGLHPLKKMAVDLTEIEKGHASTLEGDYPSELTPVTDNLNLLLENERRQRQRYHDTLADLAHSLKTPLAVLRNHADESQDAELSEPVERMNQIISHQLSRASQQSVHQLLQPVSVHHCLQRIGAALSKVYRELAPTFQIHGDDVQFKGDERDLMEILGNLIDNAFKYGRGTAHVTTTQTAEQIRIVVEDDGDGVSADCREMILTRGTRADSLQQGQGIGLAVVIDILNAYHGQLTIEESRFEGAAFIVDLPR